MNFPFCIDFSCSKFLSLASTSLDISCYTPHGGGPPTPGPLLNIQHSPKHLASYLSTGHHIHSETQGAPVSYQSPSSTPNPPQSSQLLFPEVNQTFPFFSLEPKLWSDFPSFDLGQLTGPVNSPTALEWRYGTGQMSFHALNHPTGPEWRCSMDQANLNTSELAAEILDEILTDSSICPNLASNSPRAVPGDDGSGIIHVDIAGNIPQNNVPGRGPLYETLHKAVIGIVSSSDLIVPSRTSVDEATIDELLENGFDISSKDFNAGEALTWAAEKENMAAVQVLLKHGADVNAPGKFGKNALYVAARTGNESILRLLLGRGADVESPDDNGTTALAIAAFLARERAVRVLIEHGADVNSKDNVSWTVMHGLSLFGSQTIARMLIEKGADVDAPDTDGKTPLLEAARLGHEELVTLLLDNGSNINAQALDGGTALHNAAMNGYGKVVERLIDNGADVHATDKDGTTALYIAVLLREKRTAEILIENGAKLDLDEKYGETLLHTAVKLKDEDIRKLYEGTRSFKSRNEVEKAQYEWKIKYGQEVVVRLLLEHDSSELDFKTEDGMTLLAIASYNGNDAVVQLALEYEADVLVRNENGMSALHFALQMGTTE